MSTSSMQNSSVSHERQVVIKEVENGRECLHKFYTLLQQKGILDNEPFESLVYPLIQGAQRGFNAGLSYLNSVDSNFESQSDEAVSASRPLKRVKRDKRGKSDDKWIETKCPDFLDHYTWLKYGEKDIEDAVYRRSYYKCKHCREAKKFVQQVDDGAPPNYIVMYKNQHACK